MDNNQFIYVAIGLLVILIPWLIYRFRKNKYSAQQVTGELIQAQLGQSNSKGSVHKQVLGLLILGLLLFGLDVILGFPELIGRSMRGFYVVATLLSIVYLIIDFFKTRNKVDR